MSKFCSRCGVKCGFDKVLYRIEKEQLYLCGWCNTRYLAINLGRIKFTTVKEFLEKST